MFKYSVVLVLIVVALYGGYRYWYLPSYIDAEVTAGAEFHIHADFRVFIKDEPIDFSHDKYQTIPEQVIDGVSHLHDNVGELIHIHAERVTLGYFLQSLGLSLDEDCMHWEGEDYCEDEENELLVLVNGEEVQNSGDYVVQDLDRILITYGNLNDEMVEAQYALVGDMACIYSGLCPERGTPPTEECVGGLGTTCVQ
jgi:hypothetical protein